MAEIIDLTSMAVLKTLLMFEFHYLNIFQILPLRKLWKPFLFQFPHIYKSGNLTKMQDLRSCFEVEIEVFALLTGSQMMSILVDICTTVWSANYLTCLHTAHTLYISNGCC